MGNPSHTFAGFDDWVEVFRSGKQTDSKGRVRDWKESDLDQMVANHSGGHTTPIVVGHPKTDSPAYGWADQLKRVGDTLMAKFAHVEPAFAKLVEKKHFPNRSIKIVPTDKGFKLAHVGWLGATPPAIEGLAPVQFAAEDEGDTYEFAAAAAAARGTSLVAAGLRRMRQFIIDQHGTEKADKYAPEDDIAQMESLAGQQLASSQPESPTPPSVDDPTASYSKWDAAGRADLAAGKKKGDFAGPGQTFPIADGEDVQKAWGLAGQAKDPDAVRKKVIEIAKAHGWTDSLPDTAQQWAKDHSIDFAEATVQPKTYTQAEYDAAVAAESLKTKAAETTAAEFQAKKKISDAKVIVDGHVAAGRLTPAQAEGMAEFMASVDDGADFTFAAAADGKEAKKPRGDFLRAFLAQLPVQTEFNRQRAAGDVRVDTTNVDAIVAAAQEYQAGQKVKGVDVEWHVAVAHVSKTGK